MMSFEQLERVYEGLAKAIDRAGPAEEALVLTRLVFLLAERLGDIDAVEACIAAAADGEMPGVAAASPASTDPSG